jgi:Xaa-Pro aminopeptidase
LANEYLTLGESKIVVQSPGTLFQEGKMMLDLEERDRRYRLMRERMAAQGLDALIVVSNSQINQKGFVKYLTNYRHMLYNLVVIFPYEGEPKLLVPSPVQKYWAGILSWIKEIEEQLPSLNEALSRNLKNMGLSKRRLGLINDRTMQADTYLSLIKSFPEASMVDATSIIEETRMIKSHGEQELVRKSATLADLSFKVLSEILRPGITEREIIAQVDRELIAEGAEDIFHLFSSRPGNLFPFAPSDRVIEKGDIIILNTELSGPGGYWIQMVRTSFVGRTRSDAERMYDTLIGIRSRLANHLHPGIKASEVAAWVRNEIVNSGFDFGVHFGHCLGLDVVEHPLVHMNDETPLRPGMVITVHPQLVSRDREATVWLADTYLITEDKAEVLTKVEPHEMKIVDR